MPDLKIRAVNQPIKRANVLQISKHKRDFQPNFPNSFALSAFPSALISTLNRIGAMTALISLRKISLINFKFPVISGRKSPNANPASAAINNQFAMEIDFSLSRI